MPDAAISGARPRLDPVGLHRRIPLLPHRLTERITPTRDLLVLCHLGVPHLDATTWSMTVGGLVERPLTLGLADLAAFPRVSLESVHECAGNPVQPRVPTRRVANVVWGGVDLRHVLDRAGIRPEARFLWSSGADHGVFEGETVDAFTKDLPLERVREAGVLLVDTVNGEPLGREHGFPVRLVVPGFYGTNSVKWLTGLTLAERRSDGLFTTRYYNDDLGDGRRKPVWAIAPESVIVSPRPEAALARGPLSVSGWAWGERPIRSVEISPDGGRTWKEAAVEPRRERAWQAFRSEIALDATGPAILRSRATDDAGESQPDSGARNAVHDVHVAVA